MIFPFRVILSYPIVQKSVHCMRWLFIPPKMYTWFKLTYAQCPAAPLHYKMHTIS